MSTYLVPAALPTDTNARALVVGFHDLVLDASVGVYDHEKVAPQSIRLSVELDLLCPGPTGADTEAAVRALVAERHVTLIETLAERIAARCLTDARVRSVTVRVEKLEIFPDVVVGIEITRAR